MPPAIRTPLRAVLVALALTATPPVTAAAGYDHDDLKLGVTFAVTIPASG